MANYICIRTYLSRHEAEIDREFLKTSGIQAVIFAGDMDGIFPGLLVGAPARLMVAEQQAEEALELLALPDQNSEP